jgi:predicted enzyme related to lactoylglutathione lyase
MNRNLNDSKIMSAENNESCPGNLSHGGIVWFEIPADDLDRARTFYREMFGWKVERFPGPKEYWHLDTGGADGSPDGGLLQRQNPGQQGITNYFSVSSVDEAAEKVQKLGGKICMPKTPVPGMGYFAIGQDTEGNMFGLWETTQSAA